MGRNCRSWLVRAAGIVLASALGFAMAPNVMAQDWHDRGPGWDRHHDIRHFEERDLHIWRSGHWAHTRHHGRLGWWWVVGGVWYFYEAPVYPYPNPYVPPVVVTTPPPAQATPQYWYYCGSSRAYYPYVTACPEGWMQVVPQTVPPRQ